MIVVKNGGELKDIFYYKMEFLSIVNNLGIDFF